MATRLKDKRTAPAAQPKNTTDLQVRKDVIAPGQDGRIVASASEFRLKKKLTVSIVSIARQKELVMEARSEIREQPMPVAGLDNEHSSAYVIDGLNLMTGEEILLILNAVMLSALKRAGGELTGRYFSFRAGEIKDGKRYRLVDVIELERVTEPEARQ